ncbi:MAG: hypothetical protein ACFE9P_03130 [Candidatus Hermodarchaeota archaeon]
MADFLLIFEDIPFYTKKDIDKGLTPLEVYKLCSCIRETFCLSYSIRKGNNLYISLYKKLALIKFQGDKLRFLGSDERSQEILLNKAITKIYEINMSNIWKKSTAGIFIRKIESLRKLQHFIELISHNRIIIQNNYIQGEYYLTIKQLKSLTDLNNYLFILPDYHNGSKNPNIFAILERLSNLKFVMFPRINKIENKLLFINYIIDQQKSSSI